jgi:methylglutaconyl-CoA hydratase
MLQQLQDALDTLEQQIAAGGTTTTAQPRCLIICSSLAPKVFSAGADLKERAGMTVHQAAAFVTDLRNTFDRISQCPIPVLAVVDGVAVGGGLELALAADVRVASHTAVMGLPETSLAIVPGAGGTQRLARLVGVARAKELIFCGARINAMTAADYGLVQHVVTNNSNNNNNNSGNNTKVSALDKAVEMAWQIARNGPVAIQAAKWAIDQGMQVGSMQEALEIERLAYARVLPTEDRLEGLAAFREGRPPEYKGY